MRQVLLAAALLLVSPLGVAAIEEFKVVKLEQDVRNLERQVQELSRQIAELQRQSGRPVDHPGLSATAAPAPVTTAAWLDAANWKRVREGMGELEVIKTLGPPTAMREHDGTRELLYAIEIGSSGFLAGSVSMRDRAVVEIHKPELK